MKINHLFFFIPLVFFYFTIGVLNAFPIPKGDKVKFDIIRKGKDIGDQVYSFSKKNNQLIIDVDVKIKVKIAFIVVYKFNHTSKEIWEDNKFLSFDGYTEFEDEREYSVKANLKDDMYYVSGMDGEFKIANNFIPSNYWNIDVMFQKEIFDTQKGIVRKLNVKEVGLDIINLLGKKTECRKFILNASKNPKDKGPFAETTIWYTKNDELAQFQLKNPKDGVLITFIRN